MSRIRSLNSDVHSCIKFVNKTSRIVNVYWIDFAGNYVRYGKALAPNDEYSVNTFVSHPWIARDAQLGDVLLINKARVYMPVEWDGQPHRTAVFIHIPVYTLQERALQIVKMLYTPDQVDHLEIAALLKKILKASLIPNSIDYMPPP